MDTTVTILSREGVTQGDPISVVLYGITLAPLAEELRAADSGLLSPFYGDDAEFYVSIRRSAHILNLLMERGTDRAFFPDPAKSLFISNTPGQEEAVRREFVAEGLVLNFVSGSRYLGSYLGPQEELVVWVKPQVEAWSHGVRFLGKIDRQHPQLSYASLVMLLKLWWQYLQRTVPGVGTIMGPIEEAIREESFSVLFRGGVSTSTSRKY